MVVKNAHGCKSSSLARATVVSGACSALGLGFAWEFVHPLRFHPAWPPAKLGNFLQPMAQAWLWGLCSRGASTGLAPGLCATHCIAHRVRTFATLTLRTVVFSNSGACRQRHCSISATSCCTPTLRFFTAQGFAIQQSFFLGVGVFQPSTSRVQVLQRCKACCSAPVEAHQSNPEQDKLNFTSS